MTVRISTRTTEPEGVAELVEARAAMQAEHQRAAIVQRIGELDAERAQLVAALAAMPSGNRRTRRAAEKRAQKAAQERLRAIEREQRLQELADRIDRGEVICKSRSNGFSTALIEEVEKRRRVRVGGEEGGS